MTLRWTAVGDDSLAETAAGYDLRYAIGTITPQTWADANPAGDSDIPRTAGETDSHVVSGLAVGEEYAFALKVVDDAQTRSAMSNVATASIPDFGPYQLTFNQTYYGASQPDWSPDGSEIAYASAGTIWAIPSSGGEPRRITTDSGYVDWGINGISWSPDGTKMAYEKYGGSIRNI